MRCGRQEAISNLDAPSDAAERQPWERTIVIVEALLLAVVAVLAAWSGYASSKWRTDSSLTLARASAARSDANRAALEAASVRDFDAATFNTWLTAYIAGNQPAEAVAARRFRPAFKVAFDAWIATSPLTNPNAPPGPTYMKQYQQPEQDLANAKDDQATQLYAQGTTDGSTADAYVRTTVFLATVLFLVGISGHFRVRAARYGLVAVGAVILSVAVAILITAPRPPG